MRNLAILGDLHFAIQNGNNNYNYWFEKFLSETFFPYLQENDIKTIFQTGDQFHHRKHTSHYSLYECKRYFYDKMREYNINYISLIGNHDTVHKNEIKTNSPKILLREYDFKIIDEPCEIEIYDNKICVIPWICKDNCEQSLDLINNTNALICFGHFEISGFSMYKGIKSKEGLSVSLFDKFSYVFSGHYHYRSIQNNIHYVGTPWQLTWNDFGDVKGFHIFDLKKHRLHFIENPNKLFHKINYPNEYDISLLKNSNVIIYTDDKDDINFQQYVDTINEIGPNDIVIEETIKEIDNEMELGDDTPSTIRNYVDHINLKLDKNKMKLMLLELYEEALLVEL